MSKNELVECDRCGTQTFEHMLTWHQGQPSCKPNGATSAQPALQPAEPVSDVESPRVEASIVAELPVDLESQEAALLEQLNAIREKRRKEAEERQRAELAKRAVEIVVTQVRSHNMQITIRVDPIRDDVLDVLRSIEGRSFNYGLNNIPFVKWPEFLMKVEALPNVKITYSYSTKDEITELSLPPWTVELEQRYFTIKQGPRVSAHILAAIPGHKYDQRLRKFTVPLSEGWRIANVMQDQEAVYSDDAHDFIMKQVEQKASIDKIAKLEDAPEIIDQLCEVITIDGKTATLGEHLKPFQRVGVKFMFVAGGRVLLTDEMGLGKSPQFIAYVTLINAKRVLLVCPASLKANWARQIRKFRPNATITVLSGSEPTEWDMVKLLTEPSDFTIINYDIIGKKTEHKKEWTDELGKHEDTTIRWLWVDLLNMVKFDAVGIDEGHYIKNVDSNRSQGVRKLSMERVVFMTGTPVLNRPGELWPMLTLIAPDTFPAYETFLGQYTWDGKKARNVEELRQMLRGLMIRRLKKDVLKDLPPINRVNEYHELGARATALYKKIERGVYEEVAAYDPHGIGGNSSSITSILTQIMRMKQVCAIDKVDRTAQTALDLYDQTDESENRKVLIFSQFKAVAYAIAQRLGGEGTLCFVSRTNKGWQTAPQEERDRLVQQFQNDPNIKFLVVTEKTTKEGHDITAAGHVIFNDLFWTPAAHEQAEGRAYGRLSDMHSINSYYMIVDMGGNSIEEWIMELLGAKLRMINEVVEGVEAGRDESIAMALIEKLKANMWRK